MIKWMCLITATVALMACDNGPKKPFDVTIEGLPTCKFDAAKKSANRLNQPLEITLSQGSNKSTKTYTAFSDGTSGSTMRNNVLSVFGGGTYTLTVSLCQPMPAAAGSIVCKEPSKSAEQKVELKKGTPATVKLTTPMSGACLY